MNESVICCVWLNRHCRCRVDSTTVCLVVADAGAATHMAWVLGDLPAAAVFAALRALVAANLCPVPCVAAVL